MQWSHLFFIIEWYLSHQTWLTAVFCCCVDSVMFMLNDLLINQPLVDVHWQTMRIHHMINAYKVVKAGGGAHDNWVWSKPVCEGNDAS